MNSYVEVKSGSYTAYIGPDEVKFLRVKALRLSLIGYHKFKMLPTRGVTVTVMLRLAGEVTGKPYTRAKILDAVFDLEQWLVKAQNGLNVVNKD
jgi:hypothetical protein